MSGNSALPDDACLPPEDRMGFAVPASPGHSLLLLNSYMRADLLLSIHQHVHRTKDRKGPESPLQYLAESLGHVIAAYDGINLFLNALPGIACTSIPISNSTRNGTTRMISNSSITIWLPSTDNKEFKAIRLNPPAGRLFQPSPASRANGSSLCVRRADRGLRLIERAPAAPIRLRQCETETTLYCSSGPSSLQAATCRRRCSTESRRRHG
jgi:hypothetical protein